MSTGLEYQKSLKQHGITQKRMWTWSWPSRGHCISNLIFACQRDHMLQWKRNVPLSSRNQLEPNSMLLLGFKVDVPQIHMFTGILWSGWNFHKVAIPGVPLEVPGASGDDDTGYDGEAGAVVFGIFSEENLGHELKGKSSRLACHHCGPWDSAQNCAVWGEGFLDDVVKHHKAPPSQRGEVSPFVGSCRDQDRGVRAPPDLMCVVLQVERLCQATAGVY